MPTSPPKIDRAAPHAQAGFTLVEMLVVVAIIAILAGVVASRLPEAARFGARARIAATARQVLDERRATAMATGAVQTVVAGDIAGDPRLWVVGNDNAPSLHFFADGSSSGGRIMFAARPLLGIDWLDGRVTDAG